MNRIRVSILERNSRSIVVKPIPTLTLIIAHKKHSYTHTHTEGAKERERERKIHEILVIILWALHSFHFPFIYNLYDRTVYFCWWFLSFFVFFNVNSGFFFRKKIGLFFPIPFVLLRLWIIFSQRVEKEEKKKIKKKNQYSTQSQWKKDGQEKKLKHTYTQSLWWIRIYALNEFVLSTFFLVYFMYNFDLMVDIVHIYNKIIWKQKQKKRNHRQQRQRCTIIKRVITISGFLMCLHFKIVFRKYVNQAKPFDALILYVSLEQYAILYFTVHYTYLYKLWKSQTILLFVYGF